MLDKLIKYDIKSTFRDFAGIYMCIILGVIIVPLIINEINNPIMNMLAGFIAFGIIVAVVVVVVMNLFKIFNTNVFSKEGYLTMTLPVSSTSIVFSKLIVSTGWIILTGIVSIIGLCIFAFVNGPNDFYNFTVEFAKIVEEINSVGMLGIILLILNFIASSIKEIAKLFLACSIAHIKQLNKFRVPAGILVYFGFSWIETLLMELISKVFRFMAPFSDEMIIKLEGASSLSELNPVIGMFNGILGFGILYSLLFSALFTFGTILIMNRKLDLD